MTAITLLTLSTIAVGGRSDAPAMNYDTVRAISVQHDGRYQPLDTLARDIVREVTGSSNDHGHDPAALLLSWTFDAAAWRKAPLISIDNAELRSELRLPATRSVFSYGELVNHEYLRKLIGELSRRNSNQKMDPLESKVSKIHGQLIQLQDVFAGRAILPVPHPTDVGGAWRPINALDADASPMFADVQSAWRELGAAFLAEDAAAFHAASEHVAASLKRLPSAYKPNADVIATELRYNRIQPFRTAWMVMLVGVALSLAAVFIRRRWFDALAVAGMVAGFALLTYGLMLRWTIAGRIPASNMFESLLFVSWGTGAAAILSMIFVRHRTVPLIASAMGALSLILADCLPLDSFIRPIAPVLMDTVWMSIHVPVIMVSYSVLALGVLVAHVQLGLMAAAPGRRDIIHRVSMTHYWLIQVGSLLLFTGIVTGSMWAASSWGRYWGWDPKEVWSLVAFLGYMAILHVRINHDHVPKWAYGVGLMLTIALFALIVPMLAPLTANKILAVVATLAAVAVFVLAQGEFAVAFKSILAFWLIIMTYVGVNFVLGTGLHSYGFGTGAVVKYMFRTGAIDLALIMICTFIYLIRTYGRRQVPNSPSGYASPA